MTYENETERSEEYEAPFIEMEATSDGEHMEIPVSAAIKVERPSRFGTVQGLDEEELIGEKELERWIEWQEWGPILALPHRRTYGGIRPDIDESGRLDWGAFGTVDFERASEPFDKRRYKIDRLQEKLADTLHSVAMVRRRLPTRAAYLAIKYVQMGILQREHIVSDDVLALLRLMKRVDMLQAEIRDLRQASTRRRGPRPSLIAAHPIR